MPSIKNIIIFIAIGISMVLIYLFFIKGSGEQSNLVPETTTLLSGTTSLVEVDNTFGQDFLALLLSVKNIKLDDSIFSNPAFTSLHDSSILLIPDGNEGRANPFAPIGADNIVVVPATCELPQILDVSTNTCVNPLPN